MAVSVSFDNILACARLSGRFAAQFDRKHQHDHWNRALALLDRFGGPKDALLLIADAYREGFEAFQILRAS